MSMHNFTLYNNKYKSAAFMLIADDDVRDYGDPEKAEELRAKWEESGLNVISMKNDFATIYGEQVKKVQAQSQPAEEAPAAEVPAEGAPAEEAPTEEVPAEEAPAEEAAEAAAEVKEEAAETAGEIAEKFEQAPDKVEELFSEDKPE